MNFFKKILRKLNNLRINDRRHLYKYWEHDHLKKVLATYAVDCVFDIGANNGQYASMLRKDVGYRGLIISFEPNPEAAAVARRLAQGDELWLVEEMAVSVADGEQTFHVMADSQFSSLSQPRHDEVDLFKNANQVKSTFKVKTETLTSAYNRLSQIHTFQRPFLKMDTQGYDVDIVKNAGPCLANFIGLQSELAMKKLYEHSVDFRAAISVYEQQGFQLSAFIPNNGGNFPWLVEIDCVMLRADMKQ